MANQTAWVIHHFELEPSYNSATVLRAFTNKNIDAFHIDFEKLKLNNNTITHNNEVITAPDFVVFVNQTHTVLNSPFYEEKNKIVQKLASLTSTTFINDPLRHVEAANKIITYQKLQDAGIPIPKTEFVSADPDSPALPLMVERIGNFPIVVKYPLGFESEAVKLCQDIDEIKAAIQELKTKATTIVGTIILQEYVESAEAVMFCVRVVGNQVFTRMFLGSPYGERSFKSFVALGRQQLPCETPDMIRGVALDTVAALSLDSARMDMLLTADGIKVIDVNSLGSLLPTDQTHNIRVADLIVDLAIKKRAEAND